jgi:hypothetical protein
VTSRGEVDLFPFHARTQVQSEVGVPLILPDCCPRQFGHDQRHVVRLSGCPIRPDRRGWLKVGPSWPPIDLSIMRTFQTVPDNHKGGLGVRFGAA